MGPRRTASRSCKVLTRLSIKDPAERQANGAEFAGNGGAIDD